MKIPTDKKAIIQYAIIAGSILGVVSLVKKNQSKEVLQPSSNSLLTPKQDFTSVNPVYANNPIASQALEIKQNPIELTLSVDNSTLSDNTNKSTSSSSNVIQEFFKSFESADYDKSSTPAILEALKYQGSSVSNSKNTGNNFYSTVANFLSGFGQNSNPNKDTYKLSTRLEGETVSKESSSTEKSLQTQNLLNNQIQTSLQTTSGIEDRNKVQLGYKGNSSTLNDILTKLGLKNLIKA